MEDVCNSALYCLHSVFSQPQPWHGKEGPISAAGGGAIQYYSFSCVVSCMHTAEVNDSDPHCRRNGYILHIYVLSAKKPQKKARYASSPYSTGCHRGWQPIAVGYSVNTAEETVLAGIT